MTHLESAAIKLSKVCGWEPCILKHVKNGIIVKGGVPRTCKNGNKKWPAEKNMDTIIVTDLDVKEEYAAYENETGNCGECYGEGKRITGWNIVYGRKYKICNKCNGTGKAINDR